MKQLSISVKKKTGETVDALLMTPDTIAEMVGLMGEKYVLETMTKAYVAREKRRLITGAKPRERVVKIRASQLSPDQKAALIGVGLLPSE